ncbi:MAG: hypothetical protein LBF22_00240 [Deltaproteobacteria bacterium]|jgi:hypothetical protein|nr:hypothetical protein [Deltaproteobacteria bacterium]
MTNILKPLLPVLFPLILFTFFFFPVALKAQDVPPGPTKEYFESLGEVIKWLPKEGKDGYRPGQAKGAKIRFKHDFELSPDKHRRWILQKNSA